MSLTVILRLHYGYTARLSTCMFDTHYTTCNCAVRLSSTTIGPVYVEVGVNPNPPVQSINAYSLGPTSLNLSVTSSTASWLSASVGSSTTCSSGPEPVCIPINITLNTAGLSIGSYSGSFTLSDPNAIDSPQSVTVSVLVGGTPSSAIFYVTPNAGAATAQSDTASFIVNTGSAVLSTVTTADKGSWLNFTLGSNHVVYDSYQLRVTAQPGQTAETYTGAVVLSGSPNSADNQTINVTMIVTSQPILQIPTSPIPFNLVQGETQTSTVTFQNLGSGSLQHLRRKRLGKRIERRGPRRRQHYAHGECGFPESGKLFRRGHADIQRREYRDFDPRADQRQCSQWANRGLWRRGR